MHVMQYYCGLWDILARWRKGLLKSGDRVRIVGQMRTAVSSFLPPPAYSGEDGPPLREMHAFLFLKYDCSRSLPLEGPEWAEICARRAIHVSNTFKSMFAEMDIAPGRSLGAEPEADNTFLVYGSGVLAEPVSSHPRAPFSLGLEFNELAIVSDYTFLSPLGEGYRFVEVVDEDVPVAARDAYIEDFFKSYRICKRGDVLFIFDPENLHGVVDYRKPSIHETENDTMV